jgi:hypothetical protein
MFSVSLVFFFFFFFFFFFPFSLPSPAVTSSADEGEMGYSISRSF